MEDDFNLADGDVVTEFRSTLNDEWQKQLLLRC